MSIALIDESSLTAIGDALRARYGTSDSYLPSEMPGAIAGIPGGGAAPAVEEKAVNFRDYDGTVLYSYTAEEFLALDAMPPDPSHDGLASQGWNWSLGGARSYVETCGMLEVGQMYMTDDGKTRLRERVSPAGATSKVVLTFAQTEADGVTVDWGDGSETETSGTYGTNTTSMQHLYREAGDYVITLEPAESCGISLFASLGSSSSTPGSGLYCMLKAIEAGRNVTLVNLSNMPYLEYMTLPATGVGMTNLTLTNCPRLKHLTVPTGDVGMRTLQQHAEMRSVSLPEGLQYMNLAIFGQDPSLESVTLPPGLPTMPNSMFQYCGSLRRAPVPPGTTAIGANAFSRTDLERVEIPDYVTTVNGGVFYLCGNLSEATVGRGVTSMGASVFYGCSNLRTVRMLPEAPPSLGGSAFQNCPDDMVIEVPSGSLEAYKSASGWSQYASQMVGV